jgi:hypothetical protein
MKVAWDFCLMYRRTHQHQLGCLPVLDASLLQCGKLSEWSLYVATKPATKTPAKAVKPAAKTATKAAKPAKGKLPPGLAAYMAKKNGGK